MLVAFSPISTFQVRFITGNLTLLVYIRDTFDCISEYNISSSITVLPDSSGINDLMNNMQNSMIRLLSSGSQNTIGQLIISLSQQFNQMNNDNINKAISSNDCDHR